MGLSFGSGFSGKTSTYNPAAVEEYYTSVTNSATSSTFPATDTRSGGATYWIDVGTIIY